MNWNVIEEIYVELKKRTHDEEGVYQLMIESLEDIDFRSIVENPEVISEHFEGKNSFADHLIFAAMIRAAQYRGAFAPWGRDKAHNIYSGSGVKVGQIPQLIRPRKGVRV